jgi:MFS family permease
VFAARELSRRKTEEQQIPRITADAGVGVSFPIRLAQGRVKLRPPALLLPIIYLGFISLGLPDGTLGVAWPRLHRDLEIPIGFAGVFVMVATLLAAVAGFSSGRLIARWQTAPLVIISCGLTGGGLLIVSHSHGLPGLMLAAAPLGLGAGAVDAALNGYVAKHYEARHMNWLHACWGIGATTGPLVLAQAMASGAGWRSGFVILAAVQLSLAVLFLLTRGLWSRVPERRWTAHRSAAAVTEVPPTATANSAAGWLSAGIFVLYVAVEGTTGVWAASIMVEARGIAAPVASLCGAAFFASITVGRIGVGFVADPMGNRRLISIGLTVTAVGAGLFAVASGTTFSALGLVLLGLGFAPIYPCLMHEVPRRFAPEAVQTVIGRQSGSGAAGSATLPAAAGLLAATSLELIPWAMIAGLVLLILAIRQLNRMT